MYQSASLYCSLIRSQTSKENNIDIKSTSNFAYGFKAKGQLGMQNTESGTGEWVSKTYTTSNRIGTLARVTSKKVYVLVKKGKKFFVTKDVVKVSKL